MTSSSHVPQLRKHYVHPGHPLPFDDLLSSPGDDGPGDAPGGEFLLRRLCGEVARMVEYPGRGFQAPGDVPEDVIAAWRELAALGVAGDLDERAPGGAPGGAGSGLGRSAGSGPAR